MILRKREQRRLRANSNATGLSHGSNNTSSIMSTSTLDDQHHNNSNSINNNNEQLPTSISISSSNSGSGVTGNPPPRKNSGTLRSLLTHYDHARTPSPCVETNIGAAAVDNSNSNGAVIASDGSAYSQDGSNAGGATSAMRGVTGGAGGVGDYAQQRDRSSTLGDFRDRSSTFGSDFDLGFGLLSSPAHEMDTSSGVVPGDNLGNASCAIPEGGVLNNGGTATNTAGITAAAAAVVSIGTLPSVGAITTDEALTGKNDTMNTAVTTTTTTDGVPTTIMHHRHQPPSSSSQSQQQQQSTLYPPPPQSSAAQPPALPQSQQQYQQQRSNGSQPSSQSSVESSTSGFLSGYFGQSPPNNATSTSSTTAAQQLPPNSSAPPGVTEAPPTSSSSSRPIHPKPTNADATATTTVAVTTTTTQKIMIHPNKNANKNTISVAHTPPSALGSSYEARHFGKRPRAGSISGRLRSASDLEDMGLIDREQKGIVKDLIISGDDALQMALDRYEMGDTSELESMIKSGALNNRSSDVDILGDLDLDFLNVNDDFGDLIMGAANVPTNAPPAAAPGAAAPATTMNSVAPNSTAMPARSRSMVLSLKQETSESSSQLQPTQPVTRASSMPPTMLSHISTGETSYEDDGIGDLDFNGTFPGGEEYLSLPSDSTSQVAQADQTRAAQSQHAQGSESSAHQSEAQQQQRYRANSLAFGALLEDTASSGEGHHTYGQWMDRQPVDGEATKKHLPQQRSKSASNIVGANGGLYILKNGSEMDGDINRLSGGGVAKQSLTAPNAGDALGGGIGASLKDLTTSEIHETASTLNRLEQMAERRREKQEKREERERLKQEKREQRERLKQEKKERDAREKQEKKEKKAAAMKAKQEKKKLDSNASNKSQWDKHGKNSSQEDTEENEEPKEVVSGLGMPRSLSDPNLTVGLDSNGLMHVDRPDGWVGAYSPESRKIRIERFMEKRNHRVWTKKVKYDVRKNFADSRLRVKGRFVKKEDELLMRDLMSLT